MSIRIKNVTVKGFRQFQEESVTGELPTNGLVLIRGANHDTNGSSGSGKSSVMHAIAYAFGFCPYPATSLQNWNTKEKMQVVVEFDTAEGPAILKRGAETSLVINGEKVSGSARAVEERLRQLIGLPNDLLKALVYRSQDEPGMFLAMTDSKRKDFLSQLLDLEEFEELADEARKQANRAADLANQIRSKRDYIQSQFDHLDITEPFPPPALAEQERFLEDSELEIKKLESKRQAKSQEVEAASNIFEKGISELRKQKQESLFRLQEAHSNRQTEMLKTSFSSEKKEIFSQALADWENKKETIQMLASEEARVRQERVTALQEKKAKLAAYKTEVARVPELQKALKQCLKDIAICEAATCPTCNQSWITQEAFSHLESLRSKKDELETTIARLQKISASIPTVEEVIEKESAEAFSYVHPDKAKTEEEAELLSQQISSIKSEIAKEEYAHKLKENEQKTQMYEERVAETEKWDNLIMQKMREKEVGLRDLSTQLKEATDLLFAAKEQADIIRSKHNVAKSQHEIAVAKWLQTKKQYDTLSADLARENRLALDAEKKANAELDFSNLIGREGFLGAVFDEVLAEISYEVNELLKGLPNVASITLTFKSETETAKGTISRKIVPVVVKNGVEIPIKAGLSGGQYTSVELAVDLAVATVIGRRTGKMPAFLMLDECFNGHDYPVKEACLEILQKVAENRLILVIDHMTELKEHFTSFIDVESVNDCSRIV